MQLMTKGQEYRMTQHRRRRPRVDRGGAAAADRARGRRRARLSLNLRQSGIYIAFALIVVLFSVLTDGVLLQPQNISNIVLQNSYILILAIGMMMVIIAGHIDLSVGSVVAVTGAVSAVLDGQPATALVARGARSRSSSGALVGAWQGFWVAYVGIPAFIVTLAGMLMFRGADARSCSATRASARSPTPSARSPTASSRATSATSASARSAAPTCSPCCVGVGRGGRRSSSRSGAPARPGIELRPGRRAARRCSSPRSSVAVARA